MSVLSEKLAKIKAKKAAAETSSANPIAKLREKKESEASNTQSKIAGLNSAAKAKAEVSKPKSLTKSELEEVKLLVDSVKVLEPSEGMEEISGFNCAEFINCLDEINHYQDREFPEIRTAFAKINRDLRKFPELPHLLNSEQIAVTVQGSLRAANAYIAPPPKPKKKTKAQIEEELQEAAKSLSVDDF